MSKFEPNLLRLFRRRSLYFRSLFNPILRYKSLLLNDKWVIESIFNGKKNGFFVEAGAYDGVFNSSCYVLERRFGWTGICVEPNDHYFKLCSRNRPNSVVDQSGLSDRDGTAVFIEAAKAAYSGLKKNLQKAEENAKNSGWVKDQWRTTGPYVEKQIEVTTLYNLLKRHNAPEFIDYIALDIEGSEATVLACFPFDEFRIGCLSVEGAYCDDLLRAKGFIRVDNKFNRVGHWEHYYVHPDNLTEHVKEVQILPEGISN